VGVVREEGLGTRLNYYISLLQLYLDSELAVTHALNNRLFSEVFKNPKPLIQNHY
jgi:hypothetical protein